MRTIPSIQHIMIMKNILIIIALFSTLNILGQKGNSTLRSGQIYSYNPLFSGSMNDYLGSQKNIEGSRFVLEGFENPGNIYLNGTSYTTANLNLDAMNKDLVLKVGLDSVLVLDKQKIDSLVLDGHTFKKFGDRDQFYEVLYENGDVSLLKHYDCQIRKGRTNVMKGTTENDSYKMIESYLLYKNGHMTHDFELNNKNVLALFDGHKKEIDQFRKDNNLNLKKEGDAIKLFHHYYQVLN